LAARVFVGAKGNLTCRQGLSAAIGRVNSRRWRAIPLRVLSARNVENLRGVAEQSDWRWRPAPMQVLGPLGKYRFMNMLSYPIVSNSNRQTIGENLTRVGVTTAMGPSLRSAPGLMATDRMSTLLPAPTPLQPRITSFHADPVMVRQSGASGFAVFSAGHFVISYCQAEILQLRTYLTLTRDWRRRIVAAHLCCQACLGGETIRPN
jgi:hypothetical protein